MADTYQGGMGQTTQTAKRDTVNGIAADLDRNIERLSKMFDALRHVGDRLDGSRPEPTDKVGVLDGPPGSIILDMRRKQTTMFDLIGKCEDQIQRVTQALGIS